jgi:hypothetical protein
MALTQLRAGAFPSGSVIQTVTTTDLTAGTYSSVDSANPETVISTSITPSATSSKILITGFISIGGLYSSYTGRYDYIGVRLKRGTTVIGEPTDLSTLTTVHGGDASSSRPMHSIVKDAGYSASRCACVPFHWMDSPSTTSSTTYNVQGVIEKVGSAYTMIRNGSGYNYNTDEAHMPTCNLTLMEIKG